MNAAPDKIVLRVQAAVAALVGQCSSPGSTIAIGLSGGLDSMVLLDAAQHALQSSHQLQVIHVHHGLSPNADSWASHCEAQCKSRAMQINVVRVQVDRHSGLGIEGAARQARYAVFAALEAQALLLAQHEDDQVETVFSQLARGSGLRALSAMPAMRVLSATNATNATNQINQINQHISLLRPLLNFSRAELELYAQERSLQWITDESNADSRFDRNALRNDFLPVLTQRFPRIRQGALRLAQQASIAETLVHELALIDGANAEILSKPHVLELSVERRINLLRFWFEHHHQRLGESELHEIARQLVESSEGFSRPLPSGRYFVAKQGKLRVISEK